MASFSGPERAKARIRAKGEPAFHVVKNLFRHRKARYRGLAKNAAQFFTLFGLANLVIAKRALMVRLEPREAMRIAPEVAFATQDERKLRCNALVVSPAPPLTTPACTRVVMMSAFP